MKIPYFPGCALKTTAKNFEISALATAKELDIELIELPRWNCCGTVYSLTNDDLMHKIAPLRNLIRVQEMNESGILDDEYRLITLCSMCYNTLKRTNLLMKNDSETLKKLNAFMDREKEYLVGVKVINFLELLREIGFEKISKTVKTPLRNLKVSPYYGCLLLRPREVSIDDLGHPTIFDELLSALDVDVIGNPYQMQCCGSYHTVQSNSMVAELVYKILIHAEMNGAEAIVSSCPLCTFNLDSMQKEARQLHRDLKEIPIFYYTQLMAIAFELEEKFYGIDLDLHHVDPKPLLETQNLL